jgi:hypothetical protein
MADLDILQDLFMVDHVAERMGWLVSAHLCAESVRELQSIARNADSHPDDVMAATHKLRSAIGDTNITAVITYDLWDEWCAQPKGIDSSQRNNEYGVVIWAGKRGYVKCSESEENSSITLAMHSVRL